MLVKATFIAAVGISNERKLLMKRFARLFALTLVLGLLSVPISAVAGYNIDDEDQPHMQAALDALKQAEQHLQEAKHDKGGHRAAALKATREAIKHVEMGMKAGERHEERHEKK